MKLSVMVNFDKFYFLSRLRQSQVTSSGPAANLTVQEGGLMRADDRSTMLECDFLFGIKLDNWPKAAADWPLRNRHWPTQEVLDYSIIS